MSTRAYSRFGPALGRVSAPLAVWAVHFLAIYGLTALACARGFAAQRVLGIEVVALGIAVATLIAAAALVLVIARALGGRRRGADDSEDFLRWMSAAAGALALVAIVWEALPALVVPVCA